MLDPQKLPPTEQPGGSPLYRVGLHLLEARGRSGIPSLCGSFCVVFNDLHAGPKRPNLCVTYHSASAPNWAEIVLCCPGGTGDLLPFCQGDHTGLESGLYVIISQNFPMRRNPRACGNCRVLHLT